MISSAATRAGDVEAMVMVQQRAMIELVATKDAVPKCCGTCRSAGCWSQQRRRDEAAVRREDHREEHDDEREGRAAEQALKAPQEGLNCASMKAARITGEEVVPRSAAPGNAARPAHGDRYDDGADDEGQRDTEDGDPGAGRATGCRR